jgi:hypothetical protein
LEDPAPKLDHWWILIRMMNWLLLLLLVQFFIFMSFMNKNVVKMESQLVGSLLPAITSGLNNDDVHTLLENASPKYVANWLQVWSPVILDSAKAVAAYSIPIPHSL